MPQTHVGLVHRWLYKCAEILRRGLGLSNTVCRVIGGKVRGVLTDYDLASWAASLTSDYTRTLRHGVESLVYVMLILATQYEIQAPREG